MTSFIDAINLNNQGVKQLADGSSAAGLQSLTSSIKMLKMENGRIDAMRQQQVSMSTNLTSTAAGSHQKNLDGCGHQQQDARQADAGACSWSPTAASAICAATLTEISGMNDSGVQHEYIFNHAVTIPLSALNQEAESSPAFADQHCPEDGDVQACSAAVIFNLALEHHRGAICAESSLLQQACPKKHQDPHCPEQQPSRQNQRVCYIKAEKLYGMVLKLLADHAAAFTSSMALSQVSLLVNLAAHNNLAQLYYTQGRFEAARHILADLSHLVRACALEAAEYEQSCMGEQRQYEPSQQTSACMEEDDPAATMADEESFAQQRHRLDVTTSVEIMHEPQLQGILMNALFLKTPKVAPAA